MTRGQRMGGWLYNNSDAVVGIGDFDGDGAAEFAIRSGWGLGVIDFDAGFRSIRERPFGATLTRLGRLAGTWLLDAGDAVYTAGDLDGDGREVFLLERE